MATLLGVVPPFLGPLVYLFFRPPEYLEDVRERELEICARWRSGSAATARHCPVCRAAVEPEFLVCPVCTTKLKQACVSCKNPLEPLWQVCPYCETPIVRRSSVFEETMAPAPADEPLRIARGRANGSAGRKTRPRLRAATSRLRRDGGRADTRPDQAGRGRARPGRRDPRPLRGARPGDARGAKLVKVDRGARQAALRRARRRSRSSASWSTFITSAPTLALVLEGEGAIASVRSTMGSTNPADSAPGTIRGDLALSMPDNLVHGSDSPESARARSRCGSTMAISPDAAHNRATWDRRSDEYQERNAEFIGRKDEPRWGMWQLPDSELGILGDVAGKDVLELGCGAAQWSILLAAARRARRRPRQLRRASSSTRAN